MNMRKPRIFGACLLLAASAAGPLAALAHSFPQEETPSAGQRLSSPPFAITIKFDAPIEKLFAKLDVLDAEGKSETLGQPQVDPSALSRGY